MTEPLTSNLKLDVQIRYNRTDKVYEIEPAEWAKVREHIAELQRRLADEPSEADRLRAQLMEVAKAASDNETVLMLEGLLRRHGEGHHKMDGIYPCHIQQAVFAIKARERQWDVRAEILRKKLDEAEAELARRPAEPPTGYWCCDCQEPHACPRTTETKSVNPSVKSGDGQMWDREAVPCADAGRNAASELSGEKSARTDSIINAATRCDHDVLLTEPCEKCRAGETSERCPCGAQLPPLSQWSMPHCPACVAKADEACSRCGATPAPITGLCNC